MIADLTLSNLKSYASACERLALTLIELRESGYQEMVVPSRGAGPLADAASAYFHLEWKTLHARGPERLQAIRDYASGPMVSPLYLPFTADIPASTTGVGSRDIRRFWTAVLAAIVRGDHADQYYRFYRFLRTNVCGVGFPHLFEERPPSPRFIFLDTVVSGHAVSEIMDAFDEFGLDQAYFVLVVDANGARLDPLFRRRIEGMRDNGRASLIFLDRLFTEDQSPAVSGIWSVTMPDLMTIVRDEVPVFKASGAIGAGLYYHEVRARDDKSNLPVTYAIASLSILMSQVWSPFIEDRWLEHELHDLRAHLSTHRLLDKQTTVEVARPVIAPASKVPMTLQPSSSHALRLLHDHDDAARLARAFAATL